MQMSSLRGDKRKISRHTWAFSHPLQLLDTSNLKTLGKYKESLSYKTLTITYIQQHITTKRFQGEGGTMNMAMASLSLNKKTKEQSNTLGYRASKSVVVVQKTLRR